MPERPLVSVIVPVFNGARFLRECIASIVAQDYAPIEHWRESIHADDRERVAGQIRTLFEGAETSYEIEFRILHPERGLRWILSRSQIDRAPDGRAERVRGINLDITERVVARLKTIAAIKPGTPTKPAVGAPANAPSGVTRPKPPGT